MKYFFSKLIPPRSDFMQTMTAAELAIMQEHVVYWRTFAEKGWAVAYGPVVDQRGGYGVGIWALPDGIDPKPLMDNDPTIKAEAGFSYEVWPMPNLVLRTIKS